MFNSSDEKQLLGKFCRAVEATGGIQYSDRSTPYIIADPNWTDLAYLYVEATRKLGIAVRGCFGVVQHYWLPDGTLLQPGLLNGTRRKIAEHKPSLAEAEAYLRHVLEVFQCSVNDFEFQQILEWCQEVGPPGLLLPKQSDTLEWAPPDLVDLNVIARDLPPGEIKNMLRIPWYVPGEVEPLTAPMVLVSANEANACMYVSSDVFIPPLDALNDQCIDSVLTVEDDKKMYADEKFFVAT